MTYTPLTQKEVILLHKNMYQNYTQIVLDFLATNGVSSHIPQNIIKQLTYAVTLANTYALDTKTVLEHLFPYINDFKTLIEQTNELKTNSHLYKERLNEVLTTGRILRQKEPFPFSKAFSNHKRLYFALGQTNSVRDIIQNTVNYFNQILPKHLHLNTYIKDDKIWLQKRNQEYRPYAFFQTRYHDLCAIKDAINDLPPEGKQELIESLQKTSNYKKMVGSEGQKGWLIDFKEKYHCLLKKSILKETLFYQLKNTITEPSDETILQQLSNGLEDLINVYQTTLEGIDQAKQVAQHTQKSKDTNEIDTIIFTAVPYDISRVSTYVSEDLQFCTGMHSDEHYQDTGYHIGLGSLLAIGVNSANPTQKLARMWIRPYRSKTGEVMYRTLSPKGIASPSFSKEVDSILQTEIQPQLTDGVFYLDPRIHRERKEREQEKRYGIPPNICHFSSFNSMIKYKNIPHAVLENGTIKITNEDNLLHYSIESYFIPPQNLDLSEFKSVTINTPDLSELKHLILNKNGYSFNFRSAKHLPSTLDLSGFVCIDLAYSDLKDLIDLTLPKRGDTVDLSSTKNARGSLDLNGFQNIKLENADLSRVDDLKLPADWKGSLAGVQFPEKIYVENVMKDKGFSVPQKIGRNAAQTPSRFTGKNLTHEV